MVAGQSLTWSIWAYFHIISFEFGGTNHNFFFEFLFVDVKFLGGLNVILSYGWNKCLHWSLKMWWKWPPTPLYLWQSNADCKYSQILYSVLFSMGKMLLKAAPRFNLWYETKITSWYCCLVTQRKTKFDLLNMCSASVWNCLSAILLPIIASNNPIQVHLLSALSYLGFMDHRFIYFLALRMEPDSGLWR